ncbi:MAG: NAD(+) diphosphatase [Succinivibrio sp.]
MEFKNEFSLKREPIKGDLVFVFDDRYVLTSGDGENDPVTLPDVTNFDSKKLVYLFCINNRAFYLYTGRVQSVDIEGYSFKSVQILRTANPKDLCFAGFTAFHLYQWYDVNRVCGRCGTKLEHSEKERALICPECGNIVYPKIAPAIILGITCGDRIVVTRYKDRPYRGMALIAGFCEIGESAEECARREAFEEVGLKVKDLKYFGSQPWGMDSNLLVGFFARVDGDMTIHRDSNELSEALWMDRLSLSAENDPISLTRSMIKHFKEHGYE